MREVAAGERDRVSGAVRHLEAVGEGPKGVLVMEGDLAVHTANVAREVVEDFGIARSEIGHHGEATGIALHQGHVVSVGCS